MPSKLYQLSARGLFAWETGDNNNKKLHSITHRTPLFQHFLPPLMQLELRKGHVEIFREPISYLMPNMADKCQRTELKFRFF